MVYREQTYITGHSQGPRLKQTGRTIPMNAWNWTETISQIKRSNI